MKKVLLSAIMGLAALGASATEYVVYGPALGDGQVQIPCNFYLWEGTVNSEEVDGASVWNVTNDGWFGGGWESIGDQFDLALLNNTAVTLKFEYKTTGTSNLSLQFNNTSKGVSVQPTITLPDRDGEWHEIQLDVRSTFPGVLESFATGDKAYLFAPVGAAGWAGQSISFRNVRFDVTGEQVLPEPEPSYEYGNVWYGTAQSEFSFNGAQKNIDIQYELIANADGTLTVNATMDGPEGVDGLVRQMHIFSDQWPNFTDLGDGQFTVTSTGTFELGFKFPDLFFWFPYAGGAQRVDVPYVFGASNEQPVTTVAPKIAATAENVTATTADINYTVTLPAELEGADVVVYLNDEVAAASPVALTGLNQNTEYTYTLKAVATLGGETYESKPATVAFKTLRDGATAMVWYGIADDVVPNAYFVGEDPATDRRDIPMSIEAVVTYNHDMTITVEAIPHCQGEIVVLVPGITLRGKFDRKDMAVVDGKWTVTTPADVTYDEGEDFDYLYFWLRYDGGESGNRFFLRGYHAGDENEPVAYGEPASLDLTVGRTEFAAGETTQANAIVKDANGHYLLDEGAELTLEGDAFTLEGNVITAAEQGRATLTATAGEITGTADLVCYLTKEAETLTAEALESDHDNPGLAFDNSEGSQVEWNCGETEEHYIKVDLGKVMHVQAIQLVWEGASATHYTVTLENDVATPDMTRVAAKEDGHVFTVENGEGGAGMVVRKNLYLDDFTPVAARYVTLNTSKALNAGWGMKLKEMYIKGVPAPTVGVEDVAVDAEAPVNVYTLQGVCVLRGVTVDEAAATLPAGIYLMGNRKVVVK